MIEAEIPKDIMKYKTKFIGNFSLREAAFGVAGAGAGVAMYLTVFSKLDDTLRTGLTLLVILPFFLMGFYRIYDMPLEKALPIIILDNFIFPPKRLYLTEFSEVQQDTTPNGKRKKKRTAKQSASEVRPSRKYKPIR